MDVAVGSRKAYMILPGVIMNLAGVVFIVGDDVVWGLVFVVVGVLLLGSGIVHAVHAMSG